MGLRLILWFNIGGFRVAHRFSSRLEKHGQTFAALEAALASRREALRQDPPDSDHPLGATQEVSPVPGLGDVVVITIHEAPSADCTRVVGLCAARRFPYWPLGAWEVFDGIVIAPDGSTRAMTEDELNERW